MKLTNEMIKVLSNSMEVSSKKGNLANSAILLDKNNKIVTVSESLVVSNNNCTSHSEHMLVELACKLSNSHITQNYSIVTVVEPCLMCLSAASQGNIKNMYYIIRAEEYIDNIPWMSDCRGVDKHELCNRFINKINLVYLNNYSNVFNKTFSLLIKHRLKKHD